MINLVLILSVRHLTIFNWRIYLFASRLLVFIIFFLLCSLQFVVSTMKSTLLKSMEAVTDEISVVMKIPVHNG